MWLQFKTCFHARVTTTHNNLIDNYNVRKKDSIEQQDYGLSSTDFRYIKVLDFLDEKRVKTLETLKDELGLVNCEPKLPQPLKTCQATTPLQGKTPRSGA